MSVRMKRWVACSEEGQELGKCLLKLRFLTHWLMGIWRLCPSLSQREAQKEFSTHALGGICAPI